MPAETRKLLKLWSEARASREECALATVVRVAGSSYRKPGARMLITSGGQRAGTVSGGCLEGEVSRKIWWLTSEGAAVRDYATSYDDDSHPSYGLGCDGVVTLLLEHASGLKISFTRWKNASSSGALRQLSPSSAQKRRRSWAAAWSFPRTPRSRTLATIPNYNSSCYQ